MTSFTVPIDLESGWHVDQAILADDDRVVCIRFGHPWTNDCLRQDEVLTKTTERVRNFAIICEGLSSKEIRLPC